MTLLFDAREKELLFLPPFFHQVYVFEIGDCAPTLLIPCMSKLMNYIYHVSYFYY